MAEQTVEAPTQETDPLDALDNLDNPFLTPEGGVNTQPEAAPAADLEPSPQVVDDGAGELSPEETKEVDSALLDIFKPKDKQEDPAPEPTPQDPPADPVPGKTTNKGLRAQLRDRNQQFDELNQQLQERDDKLKEIQQQYEAAQRERDEFQRSIAQQHEVGEYSDTTDPDVQQIDQGLNKLISEAKVRIGTEQGAKIESNMVGLVNEYQKAIDTGDGSRFRNIVENHFPDNVDRVIGIVGKMNEQIQQRSQTIANNRSKHFERVIGGYEQKLAEVRQSVEGIGQVPETEALKDPTNLNSIISMAARHDPEYASTVKSIQQNCATFAAGIRPFDVRDARWRPYLDPTDPTKLTPEGEELRSKEIYQHQEAQRLLPQRLAEMWAAAALVPQLARRLSEYEARVKGDQSEPDLNPSNESAPPPSTSGGENIDFENIKDPLEVKNPFI